MASEASTVPIVCITLTPSWLPGSLLGVAQATFTARVNVDLPADFGIDAIDAAMAELVPDAADALQSSGIAPEIRLLQRIHAWQAALQRDRSIPVFGSCGILAYAAGDNPLARGSAFNLALPSARLEATLIALGWTLNAVNVLARSEGSLTKEIDALRSSRDTMLESLLPFALNGTNSFRFLEAAADLGIPFRAMGGEVITYGNGCNSTRLLSTISDETRWIGGVYSKNKYLTGQLLHQFGLPGPVHLPVPDEEGAVKAAEKLGYPVVIKPADKEQGAGVFPSIRNEKALRARYRDACKVSNAILVEKHVPGEDFRITVMQGHVIKIMWRRPGGVLGNGQNTIAELVDAARLVSMKDTARSWKSRISLVLDDEAREILNEDGLAPDSVPEQGQFVALRRKANVSVGGSYEIVPPDRFHPDNLKLAVRVAELVGLDFAGVDLLIVDPSQSWRETDAIICEVNAQPQIGYRDTPDIFKQIMRKLLPGRADIPKHLLIMAQRQPPNVDIADLAAKLDCNAFTIHNRSWMQGFGWSRPFNNDFMAGRAVLMDKGVRGAVMVSSEAQIMKYGLPASHFDTIRILADPATKDGQIGQSMRLVHKLVRPHSSDLQFVRAEHASA